MSQSNPIRVLYIEDNVDDQLILRRVISKNISPDIKFDVAETAKQGYEKLKTGDYKIVFLDYRLPDKTGLELLEEIRNDGINTPVFFLTGMGNEKIAVEAMRRGVNDYIIKSEVQSKEFIESIRKVIEKKETGSIVSVELSEIEKNLLAEYQASGAEKIQIVTEKGGLTYSGIDKFVRKHGIEVTALVLGHLENKGKIKKESESSVIICPTCNGAVSSTEQSSYVCSECRSNNIKRLTFMSHPFCGYTGNRRQFITENGLVCPNCDTPLKTQLTSQSDMVKDGYIVVGNVFECEDCGKRLNRPEMVHRCIRCSEDFTYKNMNYMKLASYRLA